MEEISNREAGKFFNVNESNIRLWSKSKMKLQNIDRKHQADRRGHTACPALANEVHL